MTKKFVQVIIALMLVASSLLIPLPNGDGNTAEAASANNTGIMKSTGNVYKGPGKKYGLTGGQVSKGEIVTMSTTKNGWIYVESNDDYGWVWGNRVQKSTGIGVISSTEYANLYKGAGKRYGTSGRVDRGTTVAVFETKNGWTHVYVNGKDAWVWGEFVSVYSGVGVIDSTTYANIYKGARKKSGTIGRVDLGTTVLYGKKKGGWIEVFVDDTKGWVWGEFVKMSSTSSVYDAYITSPSFVNLYNTAGKTHGTDGRFYNGEQVVVYGKVGGWVYVQAKDEEGWVWGSYVTPSVKAGKIVDTTYANIYKGAKKSSGTNGRVDGGKYVEVNELKNGWRSIKSGNTNGWIWGEFVKTNLDITEGAGYQPVIKKANVYKEAGKSSGRIGSIPKGATVYFSNFSNGWVYVQTGNLQGWIEGELIMPYMYLDVRKPAKISASTINNYIDSFLKQTGRQSVLKGKGQEIINAANKYGINALFLAALTIHESGYGTSNLSFGKNNLWGLKAFDSAPFDAALRFKSIAQGIEYEAAYLRYHYIEPSAPYYNGSYLGNKAGGMNVKYASDPDWGMKIANHMQKMQKYDGNYYSSVKPITSVSNKMPNVPNNKDVYPSGIKTIALQKLGLRESKGGKVVGYIEKGDDFELLEKHNDFYLKVKVNKKEYYTFFSFSMWPNYMQTLNLLRIEVANIGNGNVPIYKSASTSSSKVASVKNNSYLYGYLDKKDELVTNSSGSWYKVKTADGKVGYIQKSKVKRVFFK